MEEQALKDTWEWLDEDFRLDMHSPLAVSRSLWDDFITSEGVVRSLFPVPHVECSASPTLPYEQTESSKHGCGWDVVPDCCTLPYSRNRLLKLQGDEDELCRAIRTPGSFKNRNECNVSSLQRIPAEDSLSPNSVWYIAQEESHSSIDDTLHQSTESWILGSLSDSDTSDGVGIPPPGLVNVPENMSNTNTSIARPSGMASNSRQSRKAVPVKVSNPMRHPIIETKDIPGSRQMKKGAIRKANQSLPVYKDSKPVLAYPFALVKPCGIQGDVTLQDINKRIKMAPSGTSSVLRGPSKSSATPLSGKSVVGLTKIHTEGKGIITILRTRS